MRAVYKRTVDALTEPVTLAQLKAHLRVSQDDEDDLITSYGKAARLWCEEYARRSFINSTWTLTLDSFGYHDDVETLGPGGTIWIERLNLQSITSVVYYDGAGTSQTLAASKYTADTNGTPARLVPSYGNYWPATQDRISGVVITFVAGYGATAASVPDSIKCAIQLLTAHLYENREPVVVGTIIGAVPMSVESLLWSERWSVK